MKIKHNLRAYSIIELLIAMTAGLILLGGVLQVFVSNQQGSRLINSLGSQQDNSRVALRIMTKAIRSSGHWGGVDDISVPGLSLTASGNCNESWITNFDEPVRGYDGAATIGATSFPTNCIASSDYVANTDILVVRYADPDDTVASASVGTGSNANKIFLRSVIGSSSVGTRGELFKGSTGFTLGSGDPMGTYNYAYRSDIYFLRPCSEKIGSSCSDGIPTLVRMRLESGALTVQPIVENIEQLQFEFGSDTNADGTADRYDAAGSVTNWSNVISVRFNIVARNDTQDSTYTDSSTYSLSGGYNYDVPTSDESYRRRVYTRVIQIRNLNRA